MSEGNPKGRDERGRRAGSLEEMFERTERERRERGVEPLSEEEATRLANEELHAWRREHREAGRQERGEP